METTTEKIERFKGETEGHLDRISSMGDSQKCHSQEWLRYRMILYCSLLDSLSKVACRDKNAGVRFRIQRLIEEHSQWEESARISLLHLAKATSKISGTEFEPLRRWAYREINSSLPRDAPDNFCGLERDLSCDPSIEQVLKLWPTGNDGVPLALGNYRLEKFTHASMFYCFRNKMVHEFRMPGGGSHLFAGKTPFYQRITTADVEHTPSGVRMTPSFLRWELIYPEKFVSALCRGILGSVTEALHAESRSPYDEFIEGEYWIDALNDD